ncbi:MAG: globin family protein, partial [Pseudomonadota bacterium]
MNAEIESPIVWIINAMEKLPEIELITPQQKQMVWKTWEKIVPIADTAADLFYSRLFEIDPDVKTLFAKSDMSTQKTKLIQTLASAISCLDSTETLKPLLVDLGRKHADYGVVASHYETVGSALLWTLEQGLGEDWTPEAAAGWTAAYIFIAETMQSGANTPPVTDT